MRALSVVSLLALVALAALALLNLSEVMRPVDLHLGWGQIEAPLGLLLLALGTVGLLLALGAVAVTRMGHARERQRLEQDLQAQRALAHSAEGSRFAELQRQLELQAQAAEHRERETQTQVERQLDRVRQAMQQQLDEVGSTLAAYIGEVEDRLERRRLLRPPQAERPYERH